VYRVVVFAYDFPHQKSADFITESRLSRVELAGVIGAPRKALPSYADFRGYDPLPEPPPYDTSHICSRLGVDYIALDHNDVSSVQAYVRSRSANLAIIAGARILSAAVIEQFSHGIINFHPGKIPETSGLDAFYWMLERASPAGVTAHFIDRKVDAGQFILFEPVRVGMEDTLATVARKIYVAQLVALRKVLAAIGRGEAFSTMAIDRPNKNSPMANEQRAAAVAKFAKWKSLQQECSVVRAP
jgi:phosphoribosylglycinamide formyltransferase-1